MQTTTILGVMTLAAAWMVACTAERVDIDDDATSNGAGAGTTTSQGAGGGKTTSCDDVCAKALQCDPGATSCAATCPALSESCKSCIMQNDCVAIDAACTALCTGGGQGGAGGMNCSGELSGCDFDADCCSDNCYEGTCSCNSFGCECEFDADCDSNNCAENVCQ